MLLIPPGRRHAGKGMPLWVFWGAVGLGLLATPGLFLLYHVLG